MALYSLCIAGRIPAGKGVLLESPKIPVGLRMDRNIKVLADLRADAEHRSFAGYIEWLVIEDAKRHGLSEEDAAKERARRQKKSARR